MIHTTFIYIRISLIQLYRAVKSTLYTKVPVEIIKSTIFTSLCMSLVYGICIIEFS